MSSRPCTVLHDIWPEKAYIIHCYWTMLELSLDFDIVEDQIQTEKVV